MRGSPVLKQRPEASWYARRSVSGRVEVGCGSVLGGVTASSGRCEELCKAGGGLRREGGGLLRGVRDGGRAGMREVVKKHPEPAKMGVHFRADLSGILAVDRAEAVIDTLEQYEVQVPPPPSISV